LSLYVSQRAFPRPELQSTGWLTLNPSVTWPVALVAAIRKGADRVWDVGPLDVREVRPQRRDWVNTGPFATWPSAFSAAIHPGSDFVLKGGRLDLPDITAQDGWVFNALPTGGPTTAQELPAFVQARQEFLWRPALFPEVLTEPAPYFTSLAWALFGMRNAGNLVSAGRLLDVWTVEPAPAPRYASLPGSLFYAVRHNGGELVAAAPVLDVRTVEPEPAAPYYVQPWSLFAAVRNAGELVGAAPVLDVRTITGPPAWIFSSLPVVTVTTAQMLPALIQARQELLLYRLPTSPEVLAEPAPVFTTLAWNLFGFQRGADTTASGLVLDVRSVDRQGTGWLFVNIPAPALVAAQFVPAIQAHAEWLWRPPVFPEVLAEPAPTFTRLPWALFGFQRGAETTAGGSLLDVRLVDRQTVAWLMTSDIFNVAWTGIRDGGDMVGPRSVLDPRLEPYLRLGWTTQPGIPVIIRAGATPRRPDMVWRAPFLRPQDFQLWGSVVPLFTVKTPGVPSRPVLLYGADMRPVILLGADGRAVRLYGSDIRPIPLAGGDSRPGSLYGDDDRPASLLGPEED
jgi:hypothetical protein